MRTQVVALLWVAAVAGADPLILPPPPSGAPPVHQTLAKLELLDRLMATASDADRPDLLLRKANLYLQLSSFYAPQPSDDAQKQATAWRLASIKLLLELADDPRQAAYPRQDEVLFTLSYQLTQAKREDLARKVFKRLLADFPRSRFIPDVFLSFGDYYFGEKNFDDARKFYDKVVSFEGSPLLYYARYRLGWCAFNQGDYRQALADFTEVAEKAGNQRLREEARKMLEQVTIATKPARVPH